MFPSRTVIWDAVLDLGRRAHCRLTGHKSYMDRSERKIGWRVDHITGTGGPILVKESQVRCSRCEQPLGELKRELIYGDETVGD